MQLIFEELRYKRCRQVDRVNLKILGSLKTTDGLKSSYGFSKISNFLERILMKHIEFMYSLKYKLLFIWICSIRIRSRKRDIFERPQQHISNFYVDKNLIIFSSVLGNFLHRIGTFGRSEEETGRVVDLTA